MYLPRSALRTVSDLNLTFKSHVTLKKLSQYLRRGLKQIRHKLSFKQAMTHLLIPI